MDSSTTLCLHACSRILASLSLLLVATMATAGEALVWRYPGGAYGPIELQLKEDGQAVLAGGYEFYNPGSWYLSADNLLILRFEKIDHSGEEVMKQQLEGKCLLQVHDKTLTYSLKHCAGKIFFMGVNLFKQP